MFFFFLISLNNSAANEAESHEGQTQRLCFAHCVTVLELMRKQPYRAQVNLFQLCRAGEARLAYAWYGCTQTGQKFQMRWGGGSDS